MTQETLQKARVIDDELKSLSLANIKGARNIIPSVICFSFIRDGLEGNIEQCTTDVCLSDEMKQIIRQVCEDRIEDLKRQLEAL